MDYVLHSDSFTIKKLIDYCQARQGHFCKERSETQLEILYEVVRKSMRNHDGYVNEN